MFSTCSDEDELREFSSRIGKKKNSDRADGQGDADGFDFELDLDWGGKKKRSTREKILTGWSWRAGCVGQGHHNGPVGHS